MRTYTTHFHYALKSSISNRLLQKRSLRTYPQVNATFSDSPDAKGYITQIANTTSKSRVPVKKVIVIGSGGLSIGYDCCKSLR